MFRIPFLIAVTVGFASLIGGCAKAIVEPTQTPSSSLARPDKIIVTDFAVTPSEVKLDKGLMATALRDAQDRAPSEEEMRVGHMVASKLSEKLVEELNKAGIVAVHAKMAAAPSPTSAILTGQFVTVNQGDQTARIWLGFGFGGSELQTRMQVVQAGKIVAQGETRTKAAVKPGMLTSLGVGAAAGTVGTSAAVGAAGAGFSETFLANVEADASRTAAEVTKRIKKYYVERGWLPG
jgi:hypothetical protein